MNSPHPKATAALQDLEADPERGLTRQDAASRLARSGPNELVGTGLPPALKGLVAPTAKVLRDGGWAEIPARELVQGDVLRVQAGETLPADLLWIETDELHVQESALTGGTEPVEKHTGTDDHRSLGYMGTLVTSGGGVGVVTATGMRTELGRIAGLLQAGAEEKGSWRKQVASPARWLGVGFALALLVILSGWARGEEPGKMILSALVAFLPISLPALVILILRQGARRIAARGARVHRLAVVERLGSTTVICSDQTGTLTENRMTVAVLDVAGHALDLTETMDRSGSFAAARGLSAPAQSALSLTAMGAALCNDAALMDIGEGRFHTVGDATDGALVTAAASMGYWKSALDASFPRVAALPFDSERKRMTTVHDLFEYDPTILAGLQIGIRRYIAFTKGSVEGLLGLSTSVWMDEAARPMDAELKARIQAAQVRLMQKGMRVLGVAFRLLDELPGALEDDLEQNLTFLGLFGMVDPPRLEVPEALERMKAAGIRMVMLTGDAPLAAFETARQLGIMDMPAPEPTLKRVMTGAQLEKLSDEELERNVEDVRVFARLAPIQKLKIVQALQKNSQVVAITGDGVSDAPALRRADIGAAMGLGGTQVSKEAADLVLLDDHFAALADAVQEGRGVHGVLRKLVRFLMAGNLSRLLVLLIAPFLGMPQPLSWLQLLWLGVLVDGLLGLGLSLEIPPSSMNRPREKADFTYSAAWQAVGIGLLTAALAILAYFTGRAAWESVTFAFLAFAQIAHFLAARSRRIPFLSFGLLVLVFALQLAALYLPPLAQLLGVVPLTSPDLSFALVSGALVFAVVESVRRALRRMEALPRRD